MTQHFSQGILWPRGEHSPQTGQVGYNIYIYCLLYSKVLRERGGVITQVPFAMLWGYQLYFIPLSVSFNVWFLTFNRSKNLKCSKLYSLCICTLRWHFFLPNSTSCWKIFKKGKKQLDLKIPKSYKIQINLNHLSFCLVIKNLQF